ncbi:hypothetical protein FOLKNPGA_01500 [Legionella sp. PC1000]|nr:hypothetical protein FOLKNPGA_01500 [Legionella sp. PC1000]
MSRLTQIHKKIFTNFHAYLANKKQSLIKFGKTEQHKFTRSAPFCS